MSNFCQDLNTFQNFTHFKIVIKNLVGECLAWDLTRGANEERKLLAREEIIVPVPDERTGFFFPAMYSRATNLEDSIS